MPSGSRLVARTWTRGQRPSSSSATRGDVADQVLAVVEDDERGAVGERVEDAVQRVGGRDARRGGALEQRGLAQAERGEDRGPDAAGLDDRGELDEPDAVGRLGQVVRAGLAGQPGLPGPARAEERDEPVSRDRLGDARELLGAADEARQRRAQVGARRPGGVAGVGRARGDLAAQHREVHGLELGAGSTPSSSASAVRIRS